MTTQHTEQSERENIIKWLRSIRSPYAGIPAAMLAESDHNAPWLTEAHMLCTDHGIPHGNITERIKALREKLAEDKNGPIMQRGTNGDGTPWMGTMRECLEDAKEAARVEAAERRRLEALLAEDKAGGVPVARVAEVHMSRYTIEWTNGPFPEGTLLYTHHHPQAEAGGEPVAWRTFDGEGGYDYRTYEDNENYRDEYIKLNGEKYASWVEPLYTHHQPQAEAVRVPEGYALVPVEPTPEMLACIAYKDFRTDWEAGKKLQNDQRGENRVPFATEYEIAAGQYMRMLAAAPKQEQAERVPLTDEQIAAAMTGQKETGVVFKHVIQIARAIEAAHGIGKTV